MDFMPTVKDDPAASSGTKLKSGHRRREGLEKNSYNVGDAKTHLSEILEHVEETGEEILLTLLAKLEPFYGKGFFSFQADFLGRPPFAPLARAAAALVGEVAAPPRRASSRIHALLPKMPTTSEGMLKSASNFSQCKPKPLPSTYIRQIFVGSACQALRFVHWKDEGAAVG